ncbi:MAG: DMT family transporter [Litorimonas sp.]
MRTLLLTLAALIAFAANSVLTRIGLTLGEIGPWSFTLIRLLSGAIILTTLAQHKAGTRHNVWHSGSWRGAIALLIYASFFSYAYLSLPAGTGALILFAMVQVTMLGAGLISGERFSKIQWLGTGLAMGGLVYLLTPNIAPPSPLGALLMALAGIGWGIYSLLGRQNTIDPTAQTAGNFLRAAPIIIILSTPIFFTLPETTPAVNGIILAVISGALTSGLGYVIWYAALKSLSATRAGVAQLSVPPLAAFGGILFLNEPVDLRFTLATLIIFTGIILAVLWPKNL